MVAGLDPTGLSLLAAALSGAGLGAVGVLLLFAQGARPRAYSVALGLFLVLWSAILVAANAGALATQRSDLELGRTLLLVHAGVLVVAYLPLLHFAFSYPSPRGPLRWGPAGWALLLAPGALGAIAMNIDARLFHRGFLATPNHQSDWGPLFWIYFALFMLSFFAALMVLTTSAAQRRGGVGRRRLVFVTLALMLFPAHWAPEQATFGVAAILRSQTLGVGGFTTLALAVVGLATLLYLARRLIGLTPTGRAQRLTVLAIGLPLLTGVVSGLSRLTLTPITFVGPWRLLSAGLIAYSVLRYERFDIDARVKRILIASALVVGVIGGALLLEQFLEAVLGSTSAALTVTQIVVLATAAALVLRTRAATRWIAQRVLPHLDSERHLDRRRLDVYEAALSRAMSADSTEENATELTRLRRELRISEGEHALIASMARGGAGTMPAPPEAIEPGVVVADRYRVETRLGGGAQASAFLATDETLERRVVLKTLEGRRAWGDNELRSFLQEARLAARVEHPNVVRVYDFGRHGKTPYLVLEHAEGGSLVDRLRAQGALAPRDVARVVGEVLDGLSAIHRAGILHRDLKPANVMLGRDDVAQVGDFGIAIAHDAEATRTGFGGSQEAVGTPAYMSPEAVRGEELTPASDVYSAGALLYHCSTGQPYLELAGLTPLAMRLAICGSAPRDPPAEVDNRLQVVWSVALDKDPARRFASAAAMRAALVGSS